VIVAQGNKDETAECNEREVGLSRGDKNEGKMEIEEQWGNEVALN
jgi:hypothetical protein